MPGRTPTRVPTRQPTRAKPRLAGVRATEKPVARWEKSSTSPLRPNANGEAQSPHENGPGHERQEKAGADHVDEPQVAVGETADADEKRAGDDEAEAVEAERERDQGSRNQDDRPPGPARLQIAAGIGGADARHQDGPAEQEQRPQEQ